MIMLLQKRRQKDGPEPLRYRDAVLMKVLKNPCPDEHQDLNNEAAFMSKPDGKKIMILGGIPSQGPPRIHRDHLGGS